jgi:hypothetical protein
MGAYTGHPHVEVQTQIHLRRNHEQSAHPANICLMLRQQPRINLHQSFSLLISVLLLFHQPPILDKEIRLTSSAASALIQAIKT